MSTVAAEGRYQSIEFLGEGQYAKVCKAIDLHENKVVAVKKIKLGTKAEIRDGIHRSAIREVKLMQELDHENVLKLLDVFSQDRHILLVFDFMITDLQELIFDLIDTRTSLSPQHIKCYILQCFKGLEYLHSNWILHRDLKPSNILIDERNVLKIADLGLAKFFGSPRLDTSRVVTLWYRAPELLFGARKYGTGIDIWSVGCILAQLILNVPLLRGEDEFGQLSQICKCMGTPTNETWPGVDKLPNFVRFKSYPGVPFEELFTDVGNDVLELLKSLLALDPLKRCTSTEALKMDYFTARPYPSALSDLPHPSKFKKRVNSKRGSDFDELHDPKKLRLPKCGLHKT